MNAPAFQRKPLWHQQSTGPASCPICACQYQAPLLLDIDSLVPPHARVTFASCPRCLVVFQVDFNAPSYESDDVVPASLKFYVEQGAAIDILAMPPLIARNRNVRSYLEIGCGFGFGLDFAQSAFGWDVRGIDPSAIAKEGRRLLSLPIESRYLDSGDRALHGTISIVAALEVVEHIDKPIDFLKTLKSLVTHDGLLIITTPDATYIEPGKDKPGLLSVLSPGYHAVLFTAAGLDRELRKLGFTEVKVTPFGATLLAICGTGASKINTDQILDHKIFETYLRGRLANLEPDSMLAIGFGYRLFKLLINHGLYKEAEPVLQRLADGLRHRDGIDILDPHAVLASKSRPMSFDQFIAELPACIVGLFFFTAILRLNHYEDRSGAITFFYAAHAMASVFRRAMLEIGIDDGETADLELRAREHMKLVLTWMTS